MPYLFLSTEPGLKKREFDIILGAERADLAEVRGAIQEDPDVVNFQDPDTGLTAMHISAADHNTSVFNELLKHKTLDIDLRDHWGRTAIDIAVAAGHHDLAERLLQRRFPEFFESDDDPYPATPPGVTRLRPPRP
jgi:ankyrin repeat protein